MKKGIIISLMTVALIAVSCKKDASQFQGMVRYVDSTGAYYPADSAIITFHDKDTSAPATITSYTNAEGIYHVTDVPDGIWVVRAVLEIDSNLTYLAVSDRVEAYGKDFVAVALDMMEQ